MTIICGLHLTDCSMCDHCNHWIPGAATDVAKIFRGEFPKFDGKVLQMGACIKCCFAGSVVCAYMLSDGDAAVYFKWSA